MRIRPLAAGELDLLRRLRLQALADTPDAFGDTLEQAQARPDSYWDEMLESVTRPDRHVLFLAEENGQSVGLTFGLVDAHDVRAGRVGGMWMAPGARRHGAGRALLEAVVAWARGRSFTRLSLWVTEGNSAAAALYRTAGFEETGRRDRLPSNPARSIVEMALELRR